MMGLALMGRWFYTVFYYLITPLILLRLCYRAIKAPAYRQRIAERFGVFAAPNFHQSIWLHAVSVGETIAAAPIVKRLQQQFPTTPIVITTMTPTGSERVQALFGDSVFHVYAPYDLPGSIERFLQKIKPKLLVIMETELWPNTIYYCRKKSIPVVLANARLSAKSAAGYQRFGLIARPMLRDLSAIAAQHCADGERFLQLGVAKNQLQVSGSIKFDISISEQLQRDASELKRQWSNEGQRLIMVAASTHAGEEDMILQNIKKVLAQHPHLLLVLVPRHPERFERVSVLARRFGFIVQRRSEKKNVDSNTQVLIGDTMGELLLFYGCADIALVGGSLVSTGGHNMLEPAAWGLPIITGDSDFNFSEISQLLQEQKALIKVSDADALVENIQQLANSKQLRQEMGARSLAVVAENRGATDRLMAVINNYL